jgi:hypothetical protein
VLKGSKDLYDCYIDEAVTPFLSNVLLEEHELHYAELFGIAAGLTNASFCTIRNCIKEWITMWAFAEDAQMKRCIN